MKKEYLYPGKITVSAEPAEITTILGSCVAVALYDPTTRVAGLSHYLLDIPSGGDAPTPRYGAVAIPTLIDLMVQHGANRKLIQAKVYGGGNVLGNVHIGRDIGGGNIAVAKSLLERYSIPVKEINVGGNRGRRIVLYTDTFQVQHQFMRETMRDLNLQDSAPQEAATPGLAASKIAILDTSSSLSTYFYKIFRKHGFNVVGTGTDAPEAWDLVFRFHPSLLILGVREPGLEGVKLLRDLKRYGPIPPVILYSFGGNGGAVVQALEMGAMDFVHTTSQFDPQTLILISNMLLEKVRAFLQAGARG